MEVSANLSSQIVMEWTKDILGEDFEQCTVVFPSDYDGPVCATVMRCRQPSGTSPEQGVLYVHGFSDYFFQADMARKFVQEGYAFYAVDLRRYGRSILQGQIPFRVRDLREYFPEIFAAIKMMIDDGVKRIVLMAHSTGGLICSLLMKECPPPLVEALVLNSPFLAWNLPGWMRRFAIPVVSAIGQICPSLPMKQAADPLYAQSLHKKYDGEWDYNRRWKPDVLPPVDAGWIRAIDTAQRILHKLPPVNLPVLLMHSDSSVGRKDSLVVHHSADAILDVKAISEAGKSLGTDVSDVTIPGGIHDLALSRQDARDLFFGTIFTWLASRNL